MGLWDSLVSYVSGYDAQNQAAGDAADAANQAINQQLPLQRIARFRNPLELLTDRQREILQLIAEGQTTMAIALILNISAKTVEYHRAKLMQRLNIFDVPGLVRAAFRFGMITQ